MMKKRTKIGIEDDEEAAVLIEILLKWYRFYLISAIIFLVPFLIFPYWDFDNFFLLALLPYILIIIVMGGFWGLIWYRFLRCPFCHKYVLWVSHRSGSRSEKGKMGRPLMFGMNGEKRETSGKENDVRN